MGKERPVQLPAGDEVPLGSRIRLLRQARGVRLSTMARELDYDRGYLSRVENNRGRPSHELVKKIAGYFGLPVNQLTEGRVSELRAARPAEQSIPVAPFGLAHPALSVTFPVRKRTVGQRVERLIKTAHLREQEEKLVADHLLALTHDVLAFIKAARLVPERERE